MKKNRVYTIIALLTMVLVLIGCSQVEFDEQVKYPVSGANRHLDNMVGLCDSAGWSVYAMYFLDKDRGRIKSKIRKVINGNRWYYFKCDSVGEYKVIKDVDPFLLMADYELGNVFRSFTFGGDTIRLHDCGYYPKDNPDNSLIVVTRKEGELIGLTK